MVRIRVLIFDKNKKLYIVSKKDFKRKKGG
jgi:hypothetical protein